MLRHSHGFVIALLVAGTLVTIAPIDAPAPAAAAPPSRTGTVSCELGGSSVFTPPLGYQPGLDVTKRIAEAVDAKWRVEAALTGCSGNQAGGSPRRSGPIASGELLVRGKADGHQCADVTGGGLAIDLVRVRWFDAEANVLGTTKGEGTATVRGLGNGSPFLTLTPPFVPDPDIVYPGVVTFTITATASPTAHVFPGGRISITAVADQTISMMPLPCRFTTPPLAGGISGFGFRGTNGISKMSVG